MKTLGTIVLSVAATIGFIAGILFGGENLTFERRDVNHNKTVIVDGVVTESKDWNELLGYEVKINVYDGAYIGR